MDEWSVTLQCIMGRILTVLAANGLLLCTAVVACAQPTSQPTFTDMVVTADDLISGSTSDTAGPAGQPLGNGANELGADEWGGWWCKISWQYLRSTASADVYRFTRAFWWKGGPLATQSRDVAYSGTPVTIFEDTAQKIVLRPDVIRLPDRPAYIGPLGYAPISWTIMFAITVCALVRLRQLPALSRAKEAVISQPVQAPFPRLSFASPQLRIRLPNTAADIAYIVLVAMCYLLAAYAKNMVPGGVSYSYQWEYSSFLMTAAAKSSMVLFVAGLVCVWFSGRRRISIAVWIGFIMSGALPILMYLVAGR